jgi:hypothetical protein
VSHFLKIFFFLALVLPVRSADELLTLRRMIDESTTPGELREDWLEVRLKSWSGLRTLDGVRALYDIFGKARLAKNGNDILACAFIQKKIEVPPDQVAGFLLTHSQQNMAKVEVLEQNIRFLGDCADDPRVPKFLASLLDDRRRLYQKRGKDLIGSTPRVCDAAKNELTKWLAKKGMIKFGDVGWTDSVFDTARDKDIADIKPLLAKVGALEVGKR